jgi:hypothetical protein
MAAASVSDVHVQCMVMNFVSSGALIRELGPLLCNGILPSLIASAKIDVVFNRSLQEADLSSPYSIV